MGRIVTDKLARGGFSISGMIEIEMPCCGTTTVVDELRDSVDCETCGVVLELGDPAVEALPVAA
jgi:hypothetical protein